MSEPTRHHQAKELLFETLALPDGERPAFLAAACGDDRTLFDEVSSLLAFHAAEPAPKAPLAPRERFVPGDLFAGRYRIVAKGGEGGMGEVWKAEDQLLGEAVALKFMHSSGGRDAEAMLDEVRLARRISHPGICRVFDAGRDGDEVFISMEWIDGEDLRSLLDRVGRLSPDKTLAIARQVGSALAAAHARGVLHRDIKPANLLMDRQGFVRVTDFGIATGSDPSEGSEPLVGTPAYMAPELFAGTRASERSDLYSFALVLHELATGEAAIRASSASAVIDRQVHTDPDPLLGQVPGVDPRFDAAVARALSKDPASRFPSVLAFVAALPGSDPLALAAEAGVTPSPDLVASAGSGEEGSPRLAVALAALVVALLVGVLALADRASHRRAENLRATPDYLAGKAAETLAALGWTEPPADEAWGFFPNYDSTGRGDSIRFWYRRSPEPIVNPSLEFTGFVSPAGDLEARPGLVTALFDATGRLESLETEPDGVGRRESVTPVDWDRLLLLAGLGRSQLEPTEPEGRPEHFVDERRAWLRPARGDDPALRIEAAAEGGRIVAFSKLSEADPTGAVESAWRDFYLRQYEFWKLFFFVLPLLAIPVALFQVRRGRGDPRGARRLVFVVAALSIGATLLGTHHVRSLSGEILLLEATLASGLASAVGIGLLYLALEPWARRIWPETLVASSRALQGRLGDPVIGRSLAIGTLFGLARAALLLAEKLLFEAGRPQFGGRIDFTSLEHAMNGRAALSIALSAVSGAIERGLLWLFLAVLFRWLLGRSPFALVPWAALLTFFAVVPRGGAPVSWLLLGTAVVASGVLLVRVGLLALVVALFVGSLVAWFPVGFDVGGWWGGASIFASGVVLVLGLGGALLLGRGRPATTGWTGAGR